MRRFESFLSHILYGILEPFSTLGSPRGSLLLLVAAGWTGPSLFLLTSTQRPHPLDSESVDHIPLSLAPPQPAPAQNSTLSLCLRNSSSLANERPYLGKKASPSSWTPSARPSRSPTASSGPGRSSWRRGSCRGAKGRPIRCLTCGGRTTPSRSSTSPPRAWRSRTCSGTRNLLLCFAVFCCC